MPRRGIRVYLFLSVTEIQMQLFFFRLTYIFGQLTIFIFCGGIITIICAYNLLIRLKFLCWLNV